MPRLENTGRNTTMLKRVHKRNIQPIREREMEKERGDSRERQKKVKEDHQVFVRRVRWSVSEPNECVLYVYVCDRKKKRDLYEYSCTV